MQGMLAMAICLATVARSARFAPMNLQKVGWFLPWHFVVLVFQKAVEHGGEMPINPSSMQWWILVPCTVCLWRVKFRSSFCRMMFSRTNTECPKFRISWPSWWNNSTPTSVHSVAILIKAFLLLRKVAVFFLCLFKFAAWTRRAPLCALQHGDLPMPDRFFTKNASENHKVKEYQGIMSNSNLWPFLGSCSKENKMTLLCGD